VGISDLLFTGRQDQLNRAERFEPILLRKCFGQLLNDLCLLHRDFPSW
jgi:hypothetical protein